MKNRGKVSCIFGGKAIKYTYPPQDGYLGYAKTKFVVDNIVVMW